MDRGVSYVRHPHTRGIKGGTILRARILHVASAGISATLGGPVSNIAISSVLALILFPCLASAQQAGAQRPTASSSQRSNQQQNVPAGAQQAEDAVERTVERFRIGVEGGIGLDPELIEFGAHAAFAPIFSPDVEFRPGIEFGFGELTTLFGINLDVLYFLPGSTRGTRWMPYIGAGPSFGLSHRGFATDDVDNVDDDEVEEPNSRFDFSDTDFNGGMNFIAGARNQSGVFFEMKATAYGVSNIRFLAGFNF